LARNLGKVMAEFRRATGDLRSTFEGHMRDLERESETRRIGGPGTNAGTITAVPSPAIDSAPGTVPTLPPQLGAPIEGQQAAPAEVDPVDQPVTETPVSQAPAGQELNQEVRFQPPQIQPARASEESANASDYHSETPTDGGTRPA